MTKSFTELRATIKQRNQEMLARIRPVSRNYIALNQGKSIKNLDHIFYPIIRNKFVTHEDRVIKMAQIDCELDNFIKTNHV